jgi:hypothetical protein
MCGCCTIEAVSMCGLDAAVHEAIIELGGLQAHLVAMERHANHAGIHIPGCSLIGN